MNYSSVLLPTIFLLIILEGGNNWLALPILLLFNIWIVIKIKKISIPNRKIIIAYLLWLIAAAVTTFCSWDYEKTFISLVYEITLFVSFLIFFQFKIPLKKIKKTLLSLSILAIFLFLVWTVFPRSFPKFISYENPLIFIMGQNHVADLLLYPLLLFNANGQIWLFLLLLLPFLASLSRSAWFASGLGLLISKKFRKIGLLFLLLPFLLSLLTIRGTKFSQLIQKDALGSRQYYWKQAVLGIIHHPFGVGLGNFGYISQKYTASPSIVSNYSHNFFLEKFAETGIFGGSSFLILIFIILATSHHSLYFPPLLAATINASLGFSWNFPAYRLLFLYFAAQAIPTKNLSIAESKKLLRLSHLIGLILLACWVILSYWFVFCPTPLAAKKNISEKISLFPTNPSLYLQIPKKNQRLRSQLFNQYLTLTKNFNFNKTNPYFRRQASELFFQASKLEIENQNYQRAFRYAQAIFRSWPWEKNWFGEIGQLLPNNLEAKRRYAEIFMDKNYQNLNDSREIIGKLFFNLWQETRETKYLFKLIELDPFAAEYYHEILNHHFSEKILNQCLEMFPKDAYCNEFAEKK